MTTLGWVIVGAFACSVVIVFMLSLCVTAGRADAAIERMRDERERATS